MQAYEEQQSGASAVVYMLMLVVALAFGGFVWQLYSAPEIPHIAAQPGPYKVEGEGVATSDPITTTPVANATSEPAQSPAPAGAASLFSANGPYVAQLAALQSESAIDIAWRRFAARSPGLFAAAKLDVERADLGARGVYYRLRAGYFADRTAAAGFCERIRELGQDCIPAAR